MYNGYIHVSSDSGKTWLARSSSVTRLWKGLASSSDGLFLVAIASGDNLITSSDFGLTWEEHQSSGQGFWAAIASCSSDGSLLLAAMSFDYVMVSEDFGVHWKKLTAIGKADWTGLACSIGGSVFLPIDSSASVLISKDKGTTWTISLEGKEPVNLQSENTAVLSKFTGIASSSDGSHMVLVQSKGYLYLSDNEWRECMAAV